MKLNPEPTLPGPIQVPPHPQWPSLGPEETGISFENLLKPKVGGIGVVLYALGDKLQSMIDVTIVYPKKGEKDYTPTFWQLVTGQIPKIVIRARELEIPRHLLGRNFRTDRDIRKELEEFINGI